MGILRRIAFAATGLMVCACSETPVIRSEVGVWDQGGQHSRDMTIATYSLPERRIRVHMLFDENGDAIPKRGDTVFGMSDVMVPGSAVRVRMTAGSRYATVATVKTENGFLASVDTDAKDDWPDAIKAIANGIGTLVPSEGAGAAAAKKGDDDGAEKKPDAKASRKNVEVDVLFDPMDPIKFNNGPFGARMGMCVSAVRAVDPPSVRSEQQCGPHNGVVVPIASLFHATLTLSDHEQNASCSEATVYEVALDTLVPDTKSLIALDVNRTEWVQHKTKYTFKDGLFAEATIDRGSVIKSVAELPIDILKAIMSIPTQLIQFRINVDTANKDRLVAKKELLAELKAYEEARHPSTTTTTATDTAGTTTTTTTSGSQPGGTP